MSVAVDPNADRRASYLEAVRDARREASREQHKSDNLEEGATPASVLRCWEKVRSCAQEAVDAGCPDLRVAAYLIESLLRAEGFDGLRRGFLATRQLIESSWDQLHPRPDEENAPQEIVVSERVFPLAQLNGAGESRGVLVDHFRFVQLTEGKKAGPFTFVDRQQVAGKLFKQAAAETSPQFFLALHDAILASLAEFAALCEALDARCGVDSAGHSLSPPSSAIKSALEECLDTVKQVAGSKLAAAAPAAGAIATNGQATGGADPAGPVHDREEAFRQLQVIADYFERAEPQSLIPAQLRRIVKLGHMTPGEYFAELVENDDVRQQLFKIAGIGKEEEEPTSRPDDSDDNA